MVGKKQSLPFASIKRFLTSAIAVAHPARGDMSNQSCGFWCNDDHRTRTAFVLRVCVSNLELQHFGFETPQPN